MKSERAVIGIGPVSLLGVAFVVLKLCGIINWSWLWVLAPFWMPFAIALGIGAIVLVGYVVFFMLGAALIKAHLK